MRVKLQTMYRRWKFVDVGKPKILKLLQLRRVAVQLKISGVHLRLGEDVAYVQVNGNDWKVEEVCGSSDKTEHCRYALEIDSLSRRRKAVNSLAIEAIVFG